MSEQPTRITTTIERLTKSPGPMLIHPQGGARYHPGEQIISHLNYALGPDSWDWEEVEHGFDEQGDQVWVRGKLTARFVVDAMNDDGYELRTAVKIERGWQPVKRRRDGGTIVNLGDDYKAADTDALKRAARLLGVGLDAWEKDAPERPAGNAARPSNGSVPKSMPSSGAGASSTAAPSNDAEAYRCQECGDELTETRFKSGDVWSTHQLAGFGRGKFGRVLCLKHYREAGLAQKRAEEAVGAEAAV